MTRWVSIAILFIGAPAGIVVGLAISGDWIAPQWLLSTAYTSIGLILVAGIFVGIFSRN